MPNLATLNTLLARVAKGQWKQTELILDEQNRSSYKPNDIIYISMLHAYANGGEFKKMKKLVNTLCFCDVTWLINKRDEKTLYYRRSHF